MWRTPMAGKFFSYCCRFGLATGTRAHGQTREAQSFVPEQDSDPCEQGLPGRERGQGEGNQRDQGA